LFLLIFFSIKFFIETLLPSSPPECIADRPFATFRHVLVFEGTFLLRFWTFPKIFYSLFLFHIGCHSEPTLSLAYANSNPASPPGLDLPFASPNFSIAETVQEETPHHLFLNFHPCSLGLSSPFRFVRPWISYGVPHLCSFGSRIFFCAQISPFSH